jgi:hypothetical protein
MNNIFEKKGKKIVLDNNYYLMPDQYRGLILVFNETRLKEKKDGTTEPFLFEDKWYYPKLSQVLNKYLMLVTNDANSILDLIERVKGIEETINKLK